MVTAHTQKFYRKYTKGNKGIKMCHYKKKRLKNKRQ